MAGHMEKEEIQAEGASPAAFVGILAEAAHKLAGRKGREPPDFDQGGLRAALRLGAVRELGYLVVPSSSLLPPRRRRHL